MLQVQAGPNAVDESNLLYKLQRKIKVFNTGNPLQNRGYNLVTSTSKYGIVFIASPNGILSAYHLKELIDRDCEPQHMSVNLHLMPTHISVNCDQEWLAVYGDQTLTVYKIIDFQHQNPAPASTIKLEVNSKTFVSVLQWNPCIPDTIAIVFFDGTLVVSQVTTMQVKTMQTNSRCLCWSPKGKQLVTGNVNGTLCQYKPDLVPTKTVQTPKLYDNGMAEAIAVYWISTFQFAVVFKNSLDNSRPAVTIVNTPKAGQPVCLNYEDICYSMGSNRPWYYYLLGIAQWNMIIASSSNSMELATLGSGDGANWLQWCQPDEARPELPLTDKKQENYPVGICIDTCAIHQLPWGENEILPPMPLLHVVSQTGLLSIFNIINLNKQAPQVCTPLQALALAPAAMTSEIPDDTETQASAVAPPQPVQPQAVQQAFQPAGPQQPAFSMSSTFAQPFSTTQSFTAQPFGATTVQQTQLQESSLFSGQTEPQQINTFQFNESSFMNSIPFSTPQQNSLFGASTPAEQPVPGPIPKSLPESSQQLTQPQPPPTAPPKVQPQTADAPKAQPPPKEHIKAPTPQQQEVNAALKSEQERVNTEKANQELKSMLIKEVNDFQMELYKFLLKTRETQAKLQRDIDSISANYNPKLLDPEQLKKECAIDTLREQIIQLKLELVRTCAVVAEARTHSEAKELNQWTQTDLLTTKRVASVKKLAYYVQTQLDQAQKALDYKWNEMVMQDRESKPGQRMIRPILDDVYQPLVKQQEILSRQQVVLKTLRNALNECDIAPTFKSTSLLRSTPFKKDPLSKLTKNILNMSIEPQDKKKEDLLSAQKLDALRDMLSNHKTVKIKPVNVQIQQQLAALKLNYEKSMKESQTKTEPVQTKVEPVKSVQQLNTIPTQVMTQPKLETQFGVQPKLETQFGVQPKHETQFGVQPKLETQFGVQPKLETQFGVQSKIDTQIGVQPKIDTQFGVQPKIDTQVVQSKIQAQILTQPNTVPQSVKPQSIPAAPVVIKSDPVNIDTKEIRQSPISIPSFTPTTIGKPATKPIVNVARTLFTDEPKQESTKSQQQIQSQLPIKSESSVSNSTISETTKSILKDKLQSKTQVNIEPKSDNLFMGQKICSPTSFSFSKPPTTASPSTVFSSKPISDLSNMFSKFTPSATENKPKSGETGEPESTANIVDSKKDDKPLTNLFGVKTPTPLSNVQNVPDVLKSTQSFTFGKSESKTINEPLKKEADKSKENIPEKELTPKLTEDKKENETKPLPLITKKIAVPSPQSIIIVDTAKLGEMKTEGNTDICKVLEKAVTVVTSTAPKLSTASSQQSDSYQTVTVSLPKTSSDPETIAKPVVSDSAIEKSPPSTPTPATTVSASSLFGTAVASQKSFSPDSKTQSGSIFTSTTTTSSSLFGFGTSSVFGTAASTTQASIFGATTQSVFSGANKPSIFSSPSPASPSSVFELSTTQAAFASTQPSSYTTSASAVFASAANVFGSAISTPDSTPTTGVTTTTQSVFGGITATTSSVFGGSPSAQSVFSGANSKGLFGSSQPMTNLFGSGTGTTQSVFGSPTSQASVFASTQASVFGGSTTPTTQTSIFGSPTQTTQASLFGSPTPTTQASVFGTPTTTVQSGSLFGGAESNLFASATISTTSAPSQTSGGNIFGGGSTGSVFGSNGTNVFGGKPAFGQANAQTSNIFGGGTSFGQKPATDFWSGGNNANAGGGFGSTGFGTQATTQASSIFGGGTGGSFSAPSNAQPFGSPQQGAFGSGEAKPSVFGSPQQQDASAFGGSPVFGSKPVFGQSTGFGSPTSGGFGSFSGFNKSPNSGFGAPASFGGSAMFGNSSFGNTSPGKMFGGGSPSFAAPTQSNATFENLATQNTLTFGNLAQQSGQPAQSAPTFNTSSFTGWRG